MQRFLFPALIASALVAGCAGTGTVGYSASATYATPNLAYVAPGVHVIADYNEPIFYTDGLYWRYYNNNWYRSNYYTGGWVYARPPRALLRIDRPYAYVRYRPHSRTVYRDQRYYRGNRPVYRDNRRPVYRDQRYVQPRAPVYRDSRDRRYDPRDRRSDRRRDPRDRRDDDRDDRDDRDRR